MHKSTTEVSIAIRSILDSNENVEMFELILVNAANQAVKDRVGAAYRGIYKGKFVNFDEPRPYDMEELTKSVTFLLNPTAHVRAYSDLDSVESGDTGWGTRGYTGHDTRDVVSNDNMEVIYELSTDLIQAISIESMLAEAGIEATTASPLELESWNLWRKKRIALNLKEDATNKQANAEKNAEAVASMSDILSKLK